MKSWQSKSWQNSVSSLSRRSFGRRFGLFLAGVGMSSAIAACGSTGTTTDTADAGAASGEAKPPVELTLVSYAVTQAAYEQIIPKFVEKWKQENNQEVIFNQSYGGSGSQTRAVLDGLEADVVALALALDTKKLEEGGLIEPGWEQEAPNDSIVHKSVAVIITREGNPKNIQGWEDLVRDDVQVVTANPKTSGGARWNYLALWGEVTQNGGSEAEAEEFVTSVYKNVPTLPKDAREATDVFYARGQGDALINYENEVLLAKQQGEDQPFIIPDTTVSIDNPIAVVDANVDKHGTREVAEAFVEYLFTPEAQREFAKVGFRPVEETVAQEFADQYPEVPNLFTVADLGGWDTVQDKFFKDGGLFDKIQSGLGK